MAQFTPRTSNAGLANSSPNFSPDSIPRTSDTGLAAFSLERLIIRNLILATDLAPSDDKGWRIVVCNRRTIEDPRFFAAVYCVDDLYHVGEEGTGTAHDALERLFRWSAAAALPRVERDERILRRQERMRR